MGLGYGNDDEVGLPFDLSNASRRNHYSNFFRVGSEKSNDEAHTSQ